MSYEENIELIKTIVNEFKSAYPVVIRKRYPELFKWINENTPLLNDEKFRLSTKIYWLMNKFEDFPICKTCGKKIETNVRNLDFGFPQYCSNACISQNKEVREKAFESFKSSLDTHKKRESHKPYKEPKPKVVITPITREDVNFKNEIIEYVTSIYDIIEIDENNNIYIEEKKVKINLVEFNKLCKCDIKELDNNLEKGIHTIHILESEWMYKKEVVKSRIKNALNIIDSKNKIFARKCVIKMVDRNSSINFQNANHLQGAVNANVHLGLYYNDELVSLMTFSKPRFDTEHEWELIRFCNKINFVVIGAASKLFKYFIKTWNPNNVISYADRKWSVGNVYEKLGFDFSHISKSNYYYFKMDNFILQNRIKFQKHKLKDVLPIFDEKLSESENMRNNGYCRVYDCGNLVYIWRREE